MISLSDELRPSFVPILIGTPTVRLHIFVRPTLHVSIYTATEIVGDFASKGNLPAEPDGRDPLDYRLQSVDRLPILVSRVAERCSLPSRGVSVKSGVHTTVGRIHTGSAGVAEVAEVEARSRGRVAARERKILGRESKWREFILKLRTSRA